MFSREKWKYVLLIDLLETKCVSYVFEYQIDGVGPYFDIALVDTKTIVELDGPYHQYGEQRALDEVKTKYAESRGWRVIRVDTPPNCVIDPSLLLAVLGPELDSTANPGIDCVTGALSTLQH